MKTITIQCPNCKKKIGRFDNTIKLIRCSKCSFFILIIISNLGERNEKFSKKYRAVFNPNAKTYLENGYHVLISDYEFNKESLKLLKEKSKKEGLAFEKYLKNGRKEDLTSLERNILYKLNAESTEKIEKKIRQLYAKIECIRLLNVLGYEHNKENNIE